jgi:hypothetical protein
MGLGYGGGNASPPRGGLGGGGQRVDDPYSSYRRQRAENYHETMARSQAAAMGDVAPRK